MFSFCWVQHLANAWYLLEGDFRQWDSMLMESHRRLKLRLEKGVATRWGFVINRCRVLFFQFGELQVELTSKKAFIGAGIGLVFG
ncbi:hypothetical protein B296_00027688 [Ensete ventricosum]|uniref:Uncharacterized protein n=1 Tax=Ensete ventricosum TaxID=4639 RepID=A0A427AFY7_ENSVE|nr:hypothetical protein B296_00027688 [Ensete ventricosum]